MTKIKTILIPHNPLVISKIGGKYSDKLKSSMDAIKKIRQSIYEFKPKKIIIITPPIKDLQKISIHQKEKYKINLKDFGDLSMEFEVSGDMDYSTRLKYFLRKNNFDVNMFSGEKTYYQSFVPLYYLNQFHISSKGFENELKKDETLRSEFIIIHSSNNTIDYHLKFGELLYEFLRDTKDNILIIACGDFAKKSAHEENEDLPKLSYKLIDLIKSKSFDEIINMKEELKNGYPWIKPFASVLNFINKTKRKPIILSLDKEFQEMYIAIEF